MQEHRRGGAHGGFRGEHADLNLDVKGVRDIVTQDDSLAWQVEVDRKTGRHAHVR